MEKWKAERRFPLSHGRDYGYGQKVFATVARRTRPARSSYVHRGSALDPGRAFSDGAAGIRITLVCLEHE
jgi:hypothetical protein